MKDSQSIRLLAHKFEFGVPLNSLSQSDGNQYLTDLLLQRSELSCGQMLSSAPAYTYQPEFSAARNKLLNRAEDLKHVSEYWLLMSVVGERHFHEKLVFFWHNFFGVRLYNPAFKCAHIDLLRNNCFGSFRELLMKVTKDAAMIRFLNLQLSTAERPNENYARELLELYSLGTGEYTETDIQNIARILTGFRANGDGEFYLAKRHQNKQAYTVLGKAEVKDLEGVIDAILEKEACARFVTRRFCDFFLSPELTNAEVNSIANRFYSSDYSLTALYRAAGTFIIEEPGRVAGRLYKSPLNFLTSTFTLLPLVSHDRQALFSLQRRHGQQLLFPPSVSGWPLHMAWFDSTSYRQRIDTITALISGQAIEDEGSGEQVDAEIPQMSQLSTGRGILRVDLNGIIRDYSAADIDTDKLLNWSSSRDTSHITSLRRSLNKNAGRNRVLAEAMRSPEFQLI